MFSEVFRCFQDNLKSQVANGLNFISNENMDFNDPKDFDDPQALDGPRGISIGST